jgi:hypothetical protein
MRFEPRVFAGILLLCAMDSFMQRGECFTGKIRACLVLAATGRRRQRVYRGNRASILPR